MAPATNAPTVKANEMTVIITPMIFPAVFLPYVIQVPRINPKTAIFKMVMFMGHQNRISRTPAPSKAIMMSIQPTRFLRNIVLYPQRIPATPKKSKNIEILAFI